MSFCRRRIPLVKTFITSLDLIGKSSYVPLFWIANHYEELLLSSKRRRRLVDAAKVHVLRYAPRNYDKLDHRDKRRGRCTGMLVLLLLLETVTRAQNFLAGLCGEVATQRSISNSGYFHLSLRHNLHSCC